MTEWHRIRNGYNNKCNSSELSVETSSEMSDSFNIFSNNLSPIPPSILPRKLDFNNLDDEELLKDALPAPVSFSPPYKRVRALRLFDSPRTPKTLLEKCSTPSKPLSRMRLFPPKLNVPTRMPSGSSHHLHPPPAPTILHPLSDDDSALGSLQDIEDCPSLIINPFTPDGRALNKKKRALSKTPNNWDASPVQPAKRLREANISRYHVEFTELCVIGRGEFGMVTKCMNKLDGCVYAIKRSLKPIAGSAAERAALTEVYAHAALGKHPHVVRYYSAWAEDNHMVIQSEFCDGGSLQQAISTTPLCEQELRLLLDHVAHGLAHIHSMQLVHMDIKPGNIFISRGATPEPHSSDEDDEEDHQKPTQKYKIGDLGHVACVSSHNPTIEEGDCRYLPREVLQEDFSHLFKADIFAFGLTLYEAAGGGPLPQNGQLWHDIRDGKLPDLPNVSREFNQLIKEMTHPDPTRRPSACRLRKHPLLRPTNKQTHTQTNTQEQETREQLLRELAASRLKNELLTRQLQEAAKCIKSLTPRAPQESAKFRTRSSKRLQPDTFRTRTRKSNIETQTEEIIQSVGSPNRIQRRRRSKKIYKVVSPKRASGITEIKNKIVKTPSTC